MTAMMYAPYSTQKNGNTISGLVGDDHHDVYAVFYIKEWQHDIRLYLVMQSHVTFPLNCRRYNYKTFFPQFTDACHTHWVGWINSCVNNIDCDSLPAP